MRRPMTAQPSRAISKIAITPQMRELARQQVERILTQVESQSVASVRATIGRINRDQKQVTEQAVSQAQRRRAEAASCTWVSIVHEGKSYRCCLSSDPDGGYCVPVGEDCVWYEVQYNGVKYRCCMNLGKPDASYCVPVDPWVCYDIKHEGEDYRCCINIENGDAYCLPSDPCTWVNIEINGVKYRCCYNLQNPESSYCIPGQLVKK